MPGSYSRVRREKNVMSEAVEPDEEAPAGARSLSYWVERLAGLPAPLTLTSERQHAVERAARGSHTFELPASEAGEAPLFTTLLAALAALLYRYTAQEDILVAAPVAVADMASGNGRGADVLVLRSDLGGSPDFRELVRRVKRGTQEACEHADLDRKSVV